MQISARKLALTSTAATAMRALWSHFWYKWKFHEVSQKMQKNLRRFKMVQAQNDSAILKRHESKNIHMLKRFQQRKAEHQPVNHESLWHPTASTARCLSSPWHRLMICWKLTRMDLRFVPEKRGIPSWLMV